MAEVSDNIRLKFAKGGAIKIHDGIGAMARRCYKKQYLKR